MNFETILTWASAACGGALALLVIAQNRRGIVPWLFVAGLIVFAFENASTGLTLSATSSDEMIYWQKWKLLADAFLPGLWLLFSLIYARGNYRDYLQEWRALLVAMFIAPVALVLVFPEQLVIETGQAKQDGSWLFRLGTSGVILNIFLLLSAVLVLMNLEKTYRSAIGTMRWRIKFIILGLGIIFTVQAYISSQVLLFHNTLNLSLESVDSMTLLLGGALILRALTRRGHFDADIYPTQSGSYTSFTVSIAVIYLLIVGVFAKVVQFFGGDTAFMLKAFILLVGLVLIAILLLSDRARLMTRRFASRHFQKPLYDYRTLWRKFTGETASCVRQSDLCLAAVKLTAEVFQILSATIWIVDDRRENFVFGASTFLSNAKANELKLKGSEAMDVMHALENHPDPVDIDTSKEPWAAALRRCHPDEFRKGGNRVCVPLIGGGQMLGIIILGDRVSGLSFSWQDFDLLHCVADSVAAGLLNIQLSRKLLQAGQLEAFQTMSTFFVHDLKNTTSTLNLMLKNLPVHFDDPEFRADALRGISKTVTHINHLIARLGQLRGGLEIKPAATDLNDLVRTAVAGIEETASVHLIKNLQPLPKLLLDQEQMLKVLTNLVFNAREAVSTAGEIRIETSRNNGWAVLAVSDNGCGMNPDFVNRSLFRPFQTTKKNGLGIGLFQSKMIVEAHQGRIQVETQPGSGTTFRLILPIPKS